MYYKNNWKKEYIKDLIILGFGIKYFFEEKIYFISFFGFEFGIKR